MSSLALAQAAPRGVERWLSAAERASARGRTDQAFALWRRAAARAPADGRAARRMVEALPIEPSAAASPSPALRAMALEAERAIAAHLEHATAVEDRASARLLGAWASAVGGDHAAAVEATERAMGLQDAGAAVLLQRIAALSIHRDDLDTARRALAAAHRALPQDSVILSDLGAVELARGDPGTAIEHFARVLGRHPDDLGARRDLAGAMVAAGRAVEAVALLAQALDRHPDELDLRLELAHAALEAGAASEAERAARAALALASDGDGRAHAALGSALAAQHRPRDAVLAFEEALRRDPSDPRARSGLEALQADHRPP